MSSPNIVFLDTDTVEPDSIDMSPLTAFTPAIRFLNIGQEPIPQHAAEAEIIITNKVPIDEVVFQELPNLKLICVAATGTNNIDLLAAERRNIKVKNVTGYSTDSVAQHVMASILHLTNHMQKMAATANQWPQAQQFCMFPPTTYELAQKTLGIVGVGAIGNRVAKIAKSFGMRVLLAERKECASRAGRTNFEQVIAESDVLTMHCPLTVETRNLISYREMQRMKASAIIINTARGGIINEIDLVTALRENLIAGAAIDVLTQEPPSPSHPLINYTDPRLLITPHIAWTSKEARQRLVNTIGEHIAEYLNR